MGTQEQGSLNLGPVLSPVVPPWPRTSQGPLDQALQGGEKEEVPVAVRRPMDMSTMNPLGEGPLPPSAYKLDTWEVAPGPWRFCLAGHREEKCPV